MKILVVGASRGVGQAVCEAGASAGHDIRAMARSSRSGQDARIEPYVGDALKHADVRRALEGVDAVVQTLGVAASLDMVTKPVTLFSSATRVLVPAMESAGISRLIAVTGFGAGDCASAVHPIQKLPFRALLGRAYDDKSIQEDLIVESGLDWTLVRPGVLTRGPASNRYRVLAQPEEWRNGIVSRADVAAFIIRELEEKEYVHRKPVIIRCPL